MHRLLRRAACWALGIAALVVALPSSSFGEDNPGLPDTDGTFANSWGGAAQGGMSYASRAKQWVRTPEAMVTYRSASESDDIPGSGSEGPCPQTCVDRFRAGGQAFMVSPEGAPAPYGYLAPMTVRSVGFGLMPVEATVQVSQRREDGLPIPFESWLSGEEQYDRSVQFDKVAQVGNPVTVEDAVNVRILKVLVDGVDLGLTGECRTVTPAPMTMTSRRYTIPYVGVRGEDQNAATRAWFRRADPESFFHPFWGGTLRGTITIPPFTDCTTASGDDLSDLMTLSVSGPDNPVSARVGYPCTTLEDNFGRPLRAGENTPARARPASVASGTDTPCIYGTQKFEYPARGAD